MDEVPYSDESLFVRLMKCIQEINSSTFNKKELKGKFEFHMSEDENLTEFIFGPFKEKVSRYDYYIPSILGVLENMNFIERTSSSNTLYRASGTPDDRLVMIEKLKSDQIVWDYVLYANLTKSSVPKLTPIRHMMVSQGMIPTPKAGTELKNKNKKEIFNIGKGLFWNSLSYLHNTTQRSHFLVWLSNEAYEIDQQNTEWRISINEELVGSVGESLEWLLEPRRKGGGFEDDFSLLYQAKQEMFDAESLLYFWEIVSKLGFNPTRIPQEGIMLLNSPSTTFTGIEYHLEPRGQLFDGTCLATSFELICDHLTRSMPAIRNQDVRSHSIHPNHEIDNLGSPFPSIQLDGTELNWNQGMMHSAILGQTARMWLLAESFGFTVALHSPEIRNVMNAGAKLPWYGNVKRLNFSSRHVELPLDIDSWKQRLIEILLRGNLPLICIDSNDYSQQLQDGTYIWVDGDAAAERDKKASLHSKDNSGVRHQHQEWEGNMEKEQIGHAMTISGVHLRKPINENPVLLWKILDSNPGHGFLMNKSTEPKYKFDSQYTTRKNPNGGDVLWLTSNELFNLLDLSGVLIHEIAWTKDNPVNNGFSFADIEDPCHTGKFRPLTNLTYNR
jgi:hypothetical protein